MAARSWARVSGKQDPVNLKVVWQGEAADAGQVAEAVAAARQAFPAWARLPFAARQAIVEKFAALLEASKGGADGDDRRRDRKAALGGGRGSDSDDQQGGDLGEGLPRPHRRTAQRSRPTAPPRCVTGRTACWRCLAPITFPAICRTGTSYRRCWRAILWSLNPANSPVQRRSGGETMAAGRPARRGAQPGAGRSGNQRGAQRSGGYRRAAVYRQLNHRFSSASPAGRAAAGRSSRWRWAAITR